MVVRVIQVSCPENQSTENRHRTIRHQAQLIVRDRRAEHEQQHAENTAHDDSAVVMTAIACTESNHAERQHDNEHLRVQVALAKLGEEGQSCHDQRQRETVQQT